MGGGMKWYMRVLLAVAFALLFVGAGMTAVQAKGGDGGGITPQWWYCEYVCVVQFCGGRFTALYEHCYHDGSMQDFWEFVRCGC